MKIYLFNLQNIFVNIEVKWRQMKRREEGGGTCSCSAFFEFFPMLNYICSNCKIYLLKSFWKSIKIRKIRTSENIKAEDKWRGGKREGEHVLAALYFGQKLPPLICLSQWMREEIEGNLVCLQTFQAFNVFLMIRFLLLSFFVPLPLHCWHGSYLKFVQRWDTFLTW